MNTDSRIQAQELIKGAYDLHVHSYPDHDSRSVNDFELLEEAENYGMAGVLIKNHYEPTTARATLVNLKHVGQARMYGSVTLNWASGGVNPYAVESAARMGAKMVWLPTREAEASIRHSGLGTYRPRPPLRVVDDQGKPLSSLMEVFEVAKAYNLPVSTGHISTQESLTACRVGLDMGLTMVLSHPEYAHTPVTLAEQRCFVEMGGLIEKDWVDIALGMATIEEVADSIRALGAQHIYLATDRGQANGEHPAEAMILFLSGLLNCGITPKDIRTMVCDNPRVVLREA